MCKSVGVMCVWTNIDKHAYDKETDTPNTKNIQRVIWMHEHKRKKGKQNKEEIMINMHTDWMT